MENIPKHIALIPDGNRRWARRRGFHPWIGHRAGSKALEKVLDKAYKLGIPYFTFWGSSLDNLIKRPKVEVNFLIKLYTEYFKKVIKDRRVHQNEVKIRVFGSWKEMFSEEAKKAINKAIEATKKYDRYFLTFLLAYNGTDEMITCIQNISNLAQNKAIKVTDDLIKKNLLTKEMPLVDLVIRTGCENDPHMSTGFMMWDTACSQYHFTETLFPDFSPEEFEETIKDFDKKERRMGG